MGSLLAMAQPKFASKVRKGIVSVNTYDKQWRGGGRLPRVQGGLQGGCD